MVGRVRPQIAALEADAARLGSQRSGDAVDQGALARTVRTDQSESLARPHEKIDALERDEAAEALGHSGNLKQRFAHRFLRRRHASTQPMMPFGARVTNSTSSTPTMSRIQAEEIVTCTTCCTVPSSTAPISGPTQLIMPPMSGMAMLLTAYERLKAALGSTYDK